MRGGPRRRVAGRLRQRHVVGRPVRPGVSSDVAGMGLALLAAAAGRPGSG
jgi:hypothetical protein